MEHTILDPFVPKISLYRTPAAIFELHIHLSSAVHASDIQITPHGDYFTVSGTLTPNPRRDSEGRQGKLVWTDQACGRFGRDVRINLSPGTEYVVLEQLQEDDDYVIRYTIRNSTQILNPHVSAMPSRCPHNIFQDNLHQQVNGLHAAGVAHSHDLNTTVLLTGASNAQHNFEHHDTHSHNDLFATNLLHMHQHDRMDNHLDTLSNVHTLPAFDSMNFSNGNIPDGHGSASGFFVKSASQFDIMQSSNEASQSFRTRYREGLLPVHARFMDAVDSIPTTTSAFLSNISSTSQGKGIGVQRTVDVPPTSSSRLLKVDASAATAVADHPVTTHNPVPIVSHMQEDLVTAVSGKMRQDHRLNAVDGLFNHSHVVLAEPHGRQKALDSTMLPAGSNLHFSREEPTERLGVVQQPKVLHKFDAPRKATGSSDSSSSAGREQEVRFTDVGIPANLGFSILKGDMTHSSMGTAGELNLTHRALEHHAQSSSVSKERRSQETSSNVPVILTSRELGKTAIEPQNLQVPFEVGSLPLVPPEFVSVLGGSEIDNLPVADARNLSLPIDSSNSQTLESTGARNFPSCGNITDLSRRTDSVQQGCHERSRDSHDLATKSHSYVTRREQTQDLEGMPPPIKSSGFDHRTTAIDTSGSKDTVSRTDIAVLPAGPNLPTRGGQDMQISEGFAQDMPARRGSPAPIPVSPMASSPALHDRDITRQPLTDTPHNSKLVCMPESDVQAREVSIRNITETGANNTLLPNNSLKSTVICNLDAHNRHSDTLDVSASQHHLEEAIGIVDLPPERNISTSDAQPVRSIVSGTSDLEVYDDSLVPDAKVSRDRHVLTSIPFNVTASTAGHDSVVLSEKQKDHVETVQTIFEQDTRSTLQSKSNTMFMATEADQCSNATVIPARGDLAILAPIAQEAQLKDTFEVESEVVEECNKTKNRQVASVSAQGTKTAEGRANNHSPNKSVNSSRAVTTCKELNMRKDSKTTTEQFSTQQATRLSSLTTDLEPSVTISGTVLHDLAAVHRGHEHMNTTQRLVRGSENTITGADSLERGQSPGSSSQPISVTVVAPEQGISATAVSESHKQRLQTESKTTVAQQQYDKSSTRQLIPGLPLPTFVTDCDNNQRHDRGFHTDYNNSMITSESRKDMKDATETLLISRQVVQTPMKEELYNVRNQSSEVGISRDSSVGNHRDVNVTMYGEEPLMHAGLESQHAPAKETSKTLSTLVSSESANMHTRVIVSASNHNTVEDCQDRIQVEIIPESAAQTKILDTQATPANREQHISNTLGSGEEQILERIEMEHTSSELIAQSSTERIMQRSTEVEARSPTFIGQTMVNSYRHTSTDSFDESHRNSQELSLLTEPKQCNMQKESAECSTQQIVRMPTAEERGTLTPDAMIAGSALFSSAVQACDQEGLVDHVDHTIYNTMPTSSVPRLEAERAREQSENLNIGTQQIVQNPGLDNGESVGHNIFAGTTRSSHSTECHDSQVEAMVSSREPSGLNAPVVVTESFSHKNLTECLQEPPNFTNSTIQRREDKPQELTNEQFEFTQKSINTDVATSTTGAAMLVSSFEHFSEDAHVEITFKTTEQNVQMSTEPEIIDKSPGTATPAVQNPSTLITPQEEKELDLPAAAEGGTTASHHEEHFQEIDTIVTHAIQDRSAENKALLSFTEPLCDTTREPIRDLHFSEVAPIPTESIRPNGVDIDGRLVVEDRIGGSDNVDASHSDSNRSVGPNAGNDRSTIPPGSLPVIRHGKDVCEAHERTARFASKTELSTVTEAENTVSATKYYNDCGEITASPIPNGMSSYLSDASTISNLRDQSAAAEVSSLVTTGAKNHQALDVTLIPAGLPHLTEEENIVPEPPSRHRDGHLESLDEAVILADDNLSIASRRTITKKQHEDYLHTGNNIDKEHSDNVDQDCSEVTSTHIEWKHAATKEASHTVASQHVDDTHLSVTKAPSINTENYITMDIDHDEQARPLNLKLNSNNTNGNVTEGITLTKQCSEESLQIHCEATDSPGTIHSTTNIAETHSSANELSTHIEINEGYELQDTTTMISQITHPNTAEAIGTGIGDIQITLPIADTDHSSYLQSFDTAPTPKAIAVNGTTDGLSSQAAIDTDEIITSEGHHVQHISTIVSFEKAHSKGDVYTSRSLAGAEDEHESEVCTKNPVNSVEEGVLQTSARTEYGEHDISISLPHHDISEPSNMSIVDNSAIDGLQIASTVRGVSFQSSGQIISNSSSEEKKSTDYASTSADQDFRSIHMGASDAPATENSDTHHEGVAEPLQVVPDVPISSDSSLHIQSTLCTQQTTVTAMVGISSTSADSIGGGKSLAIMSILSETRPSSNTSVSIDKNFLAEENRQDITSDQFKDEVPSAEVVATSTDTSKAGEIVTSAVAQVASSLVMETSDIATTEQNDENHSFHRTEVNTNLNLGAPKRSIAIENSDVPASSYGDIEGFGRDPSFRPPMVEAHHYDSQEARNFIKIESDEKGVQDMKSTFEVRRSAAVEIDNAESEHDCKINLALPLDTNEGETRSALVGMQVSSHGTSSLFNDKLSSSREVHNPSSIQSDSAESHVRRPSIDGQAFPNLGSTSIHAETLGKQESINSSISLENNASSLQILSYSSEMVNSLEQKHPPAWIEPTIARDVGNSTEYTATGVTMEQGGYAVSQLNGDEIVPPAERSAGPETQPPSQTVSSGVTIPITLGPVAANKSEESREISGSLRENLENGGEDTANPPISPDSIDQPLSIKMADKSVEKTVDEEGGIALQDNDTTRNSSPKPILHPLSPDWVNEDTMATKQDEKTLQGTDTPTSDDASSYDGDMDDLQFFRNNFRTAGRSSSSPSPFPEFPDPTADSARTILPAPYATAIDASS